METTIIAIPGQDVFILRSINNDIEFGAKLYDFIIGLLELIGTEVKSINTNKNTVQLFFYREQMNGKMPCRYFEVSNELGRFIDVEFRMEFVDAIEQFGKRKQKDGSNLLFQLNNGDLTAADFSKKLK